MTADAIDELLDELDLDDDNLCPECGAEMDPDDTVCPKCGAEFGYYCPECDEELPLDATICPHCGAELDEGFEDEAEGGAVDEDLDEETESVLTWAEFCSSCGEPLSEDDEECPACGLDLCPDCGTALTEEDEACPNCGAAFAFSCPDCGEDLPAEAEVCPHCGYQFDDEDEEGD